ncbi:VTT domain-containing protein [Dactylosporangium aurantiacum]|uniref:VTT domain-containing protein n=1 Tax=Dactylosporangium aurantiacum TaxID=35754 RepID=A0A9Q9MNG3_9ACTN|nr:VTT domain-containing protein [Dactylosporangium aurantiacum]MDG6104742.1 VTT domain-containing protein [Dactylosporangium aurantiacum]UWZ55692.1 VTT domain-containing protein [Dactylosporangium aurantiacum]
MVDAIMDLVAAPTVLYATILVLLTVDAFIPVVPAQALMIGGGILSTTGHVQLLLLVAAGALGAVSGDLLAFLVGRRLARRDADAPQRLTRRKPRAITLRLNEAMRKHIFLAVLLCRFVPAGRMITAIYAGRNGVSTSRFATYDVVAATLWASYGALLGHFGGEAIADSSWLPLTLVAAAALLFLAGAPLLGLAGRLRKRATATAAAAGPAGVAVVAAFATEPPAAAPTAAAARDAFLAAPTDMLAVPTDMLAAPTDAAASRAGDIPAPRDAAVAAGSAATGAAAASTGLALVVGGPAGGGKDGRAASAAGAGRRSRGRSVVGACLAATLAGIGRAMRGAPGMPVVAAAPQPVRRRCRRTAMETLAAAEPMAAIEVLVAAEAVAAAESVVVQVNGLQNAS